MASYRRVALVPISHPLAGRPVLSVDEFVREPFVQPDAGDEEWSGHWTLRPERAARGLPVTPAATAGGLGALLDLVIDGLGLCTGPAHLSESYADDRLAFVPMPDLPPARLTIGWRADAVNEALLTLSRVYERLSSTGSLDTQPTPN